MNKLKNLALGVGIIVVFALVLWQGIETFYPSPEWDDYCNIDKVPARPVPSTIDEIQQFEDPHEECREQFDTAKGKHSKVVFIISLIVALIAIVVGYTILSIEPVGSALIGSGIWSIFWGTVVNWRNFANVGRFILLLIALILLIWLALRLNRPKKKS